LWLRSPVEYVMRSAMLARVMLSFQHPGINLARLWRPLLSPLHDLPSVLNLSRYRAIQT
jgi:hypothetical protein